MEQSPRAARFLEPVYLNETMMLNCATYLLDGVSLKTENTISAGSDKRASIKASLSSFIEVGASLGQSTGAEQKSARNFYVGGLHMNVIDALQEKLMIADITDQSDNHFDRGKLLDKYVHLHVTLRPTDYFAVLELVRSVVPLLAQIAKDYRRPTGKTSTTSGQQKPKPAGNVPSPKSQNQWELTAKHVEHYAASIEETVQILTEDYLRSRQLEMVMLLDSAQQPIGILNIDVSEVDSRMIKAQLAGNRYHVYGKVVARAKTGERLSLLQHTMLFGLADLYKKIMEMLPDDDSNNAKTKQEIQDFLKPIEQIVRFDLKGPAIRVAAMSICI